MQQHTLGEVKNKQSFDGKLCQEYLYQKLSKSDNWLSSYSPKCRGCSFRHSVLLQMYSGNPYALPLMMEMQK